MLMFGLIDLTGLFQHQPFYGSIHIKNRADENLVGVTKKVKLIKWNSSFKHINRSKQVLLFNKGIKYWELYTR